jgi:hypothetical protein
MHRAWKLLGLALFTFLAALALLPAASFSDSEAYTNFRIEDFPWVDDKQSAMYLDANVYSYGNEGIGYSQAEIFLSNFSSRNLNSSLSFSPSYNLINNSPDHELRLGIPTSFTYTFLNRNESYMDSSTEIQDHVYSRVWVQPSINYTLFFNKLFLGSETQIYANYLWDQPSNVWDSILPPAHSSYSNQSSTILSNATEILRIGLGRTFEGNYAYQAMQIVQDLHDTKHLTKPVTSDDMKSLSEILAKARQEFYYDSRDQILRAVKEITVFLTQNNYLAAEDIEGILIADDIYRNIWCNSRPFGQTQTLRMGGNFNYDRDYSPSNTSYDKNGYGYFIGVEANYYQPLDRQGQFKLNGLLDISKTYSKRSRNWFGSILNKVEVVSRTEEPLLITPKISATLDYYFNTRFMFTLQDALSAKLGRKMSKIESIPNSAAYSTFPSFDESTYLDYTQLKLYNDLSFGLSYNINPYVLVNLNLVLNYEYCNFSNAQFKINDEIQTNSDDLNRFIDWNNNHSFLNWTASFNISYRLF